ncbi:hypothetical protein BJ166DRAFT_356378 [Pestalotiopsis sp. NC0098]|nr:hypothetical protein BJ166DRAFT_356378 [Pestalotiopsis sp. NC0098]
MSSSQPVFTWHVVPRFDISAKKGGPLALGTVVTDIKRLIPLNRRDYHVEVPKTLIYPSVKHTHFKDTLARARNANMHGWLRACGLPVGAAAEIGGSQDLENSVSCESVVTTYFDPDAAYITKCLDVQPIKDHLQAAKGYSADLFVVTGLKVAKQLKFNRSDATEVHARAEGRLAEPHTGAVDTGAGVDVGETQKRDLEFETNDIVIGLRLNKYHCVKRIFGHGRRIHDQGVLDGDMMSGHTKGTNEHAEISFEEACIPEESTVRDLAVTSGESECWVSRSE